jgi:DNA (cytosine-5)-methyltransferase 1
MKALRVISLFTGAGGLDLGLEAARFETSVAVEMNALACETLRANRDWSVLEGDINSLTSDEIAAAGDLKVGEADLLVGGPPCQPFSKSGYWRLGDSKRLNDPRADTLTAYLRVLRDLQPKAFLLENVHGLVYKGKDEGIRHLEEAVEGINREIGTSYSFRWKILNAADYGVPQTRERVLLVGSRDGREFDFPQPTHIDPSLIGSDLFGVLEKPWATAWDAIGDLNDEPHPDLRVRGSWGDLLPAIPEGQNYLYHTDRGGGLSLFGWRRRYWSFLLKLAKNRPAWTIQAQPGSAIGPFHWKSRRLSIREMCRLQTFPEGYRIIGGATEAQRQLGNAVPSLLAEVLGREIRRQLLRKPCTETEPMLMVHQRLPVPPPEPIAEVPSKYLHLVGEHEPHPGTGKGYMLMGKTG